VKEYPQNVSDVELSPQGKGLGTLNYSATVTILSATQHAQIKRVDAGLDSEAERLASMCLWDIILYNGSLISYF
jgi:hypothetical protein